MQFSMNKPYYMQDILFPSMCHYLHSYKKATYVCVYFCYLELEAKQKGTGLSWTSWLKVHLSVGQHFTFTATDSWKFMVFGW